MLLNLYDTMTHNPRVYHFLYHSAQLDFIVYIVAEEKCFIIALL